MGPSKKKYKRRTNVLIPTAEGKRDHTTNDCMSPENKKKEHRRCQCILSQIFLHSFLFSHFFHLLTRSLSAYQECPFVVTPRFSPLGSLYHFFLHLKGMASSSSQPLRGCIYTLSYTS